MTTDADIDGGWAWVVLGASVFNLVVLGAMTMSIGMFQTQFLQEFDGGSTAFVSVVCSLCASLQSLLGSGFGIAYTPSTIAVSHYFHRKRVLANGVSLACSGLGILSGPHLIGWLIENFGWRFAMATFGCIAAHICVTGSLMYPMREKARTVVCCSEKEADDTSVASDESRTSRKHTGITSIIKSKVFWVLGIHYFLEMTGYSIQIIHFPSFVQSVGVSRKKVPSLLTAYGCTLLVVRVLGGVFCNDRDINLLIVYIACQGIYGLNIIVMPVYATTYIKLIIYECLYGMYYGFSYILVTPIVVELFGVDSLATVFGMIMFLGGLGYYVGPSVAGALYDFTSSYFIGFHIGGAVILLGCVILFLIPLLRSKPEVEKFQAEREDLLVVVRPPTADTAAEREDVLVVGRQGAADTASEREDLLVVIRPATADTASEREDLLVVSRQGAADTPADRDNQVAGRMERADTATEKEVLLVVGRPGTADTASEKDDLLDTGSSWATDIASER